MLQVETKRQRVNIISAISSQGSVRFMVYQDAMNQQRLIRFMERLMRTSEQKVFLILDNLKVHRGKFAAAWLEKNKEKMEVFFLPPYAPEYNPDEYLNHALKISVHTGQLPYTAFPTKSSHLCADYNIIPLVFPVSSSILCFPIFARRSNNVRDPLHAVSHKLRGLVKPCPRADAVDEKNAAPILVGSARFLVRQLVRKAVFLL